jgi:hypothetical protein
VTDWPDLGVMLFTYKRLSTAERTLRALCERAHYSGRLRLHIADDGSPEVAPDLSQAEALRQIAGGYEQVYAATAANSGQHGYGASYNLATQIMHVDCAVLLPLEDDWELTAPLDLDPLVETLLDPAHGIECIRMGYIGYTQELRGTLVPTPAGHMLRFDPASPEPHVLAGHPRLETREFERRVGPWPELRPAGETEFIVCHRPQARTGVAWPLDVLRPSEHRFAHIGAEGLGEHMPEGATA